MGFMDTILNQKLFSPDIDANYQTKKERSTTGTKTSLVDLGQQNLTTEISEQQSYVYSPSTSSVYAPTFAIQKSPVYSFGSSSVSGSGAVSPSPYVAATSIPSTSVGQDSTQAATNKIPDTVGNLMILAGVGVAAYLLVPVLVKPKKKGAKK